MDTEAEILEVQKRYEDKASEWFWKEFEHMNMADDRREQILKLKSLVDSVVRLSYTAFSTSGGLGIIIKQRGDIHQVLKGNSLKK